MRYHSHARDGFRSADYPSLRNDLRSGVGRVPPVYRGPSSFACRETGDEAGGDRKARPGRIAEPTERAAGAWQWIRRVLGLDLRDRLGHVENRVNRLEGRISAVEAFEELMKR